MKKLLLLLLGVSVITSCSKDDNESLEVVNETTDVKLDFSAVGQDYSSRTNVNRGDIYDWVDRIKVSIQHNSTGLQNEAEFKLKNNGGAEEFVIEDIYLGENTFSAETTTLGAEIHNLSVSTKHAQRSIEDAREELPYVLYNSGNEVVDIQKTDNNIAFDMTTQNGRAISVFKLAHHLKDDYYIGVSYTRDGQFNETLTDSGSGDLVLAYWSDDSAVVGNYVDYSVNVYHKDSNGTPVNEDPFLITDTIVKSSSVSTINTFSLNDFTSESNAISFTWETWTEE